MASSGSLRTGSRYGGVMALPHADSKVMLVVLILASLGCGDDDGGDEVAGTETSTDTNTDESESSDSGSNSGSDSDSAGETSECVESEICNGVDDDCNGFVDDLDLGMDGFCDCYRIGIIGNNGLGLDAEFEAQLATNGIISTRFGTMPNHQLTTPELEPFDILIIDQLTHQYPPSQAAILQNWVEAGHGLISMAGYADDQTDIDQQNSLASVSGLTYVQPLAGDPVELWEPHPVATGASGVQVHGGWPVQGAGEVFVRPQGQPGVSLGTAKMVGNGAAISFADEFISYDSEWMMIPEVEVLWSNMIAWVGPKDICRGVVRSP